MSWGIFFWCYYFKNHPWTCEHRCWSSMKVVQVRFHTKFYKTQHWENIPKKLSYKRDSFRLTFASSKWITLYVSYLYHFPLSLSINFTNLTLSKSHSFPFSIRTHTHFLFHMFIQPNTYSIHIIHKKCSFLFDICVCYIYYIYMCHP